MTIRAFTMQLLPDTVEEYEKRHDQIWPELSTLLSEHGIYDYSIFLDPDTLTLFACLKLRDDNRMDALPDHPIMKRWWEFMAPLMETEPDARPVTKDLTPVFRLD